MGLLLFYLVNFHVMQREKRSEKVFNNELSLFRLGIYSVG